MSDRDEEDSINSEEDDPPIGILVVNPNTTKEITDALQPALESLGYDEVEFTYFTAPSGPASIDSNADANASAKHCLPHLIPMLADHDAVLVACYSSHPLVIQLKEKTDIPIISILEASVLAALPLLTTSYKDPSAPTSRFGIVSTGKIWSGLLPDAIEEFLGGPSARFAGVETTGMSAGELHKLNTTEVQSRMVTATQKLMKRGGVDVILLGCAGMVGLEEVVRAAAGEGTFVVDGAKAAVGILVGLVKADF
ncbi:MAG: hypothetical protein M4579_002101 [Chaenotheca gracillima]|nr:MAG: hypothetical protein M4579_002101 [Chaenotheca gracillima]